MKKSMLNVIILALVLVNLVLTVDVYKRQVIMYPAKG